MHGVMMPLAMFEQIMARWEDGLARDLGVGGTRLAGMRRVQVEKATLCFSWCPVAGCSSLCGDASERPAAGAQRSEHRQRDAMASNTTPFSAKLALGQPNAPVWCEDE
jgi:hypothetical protein